MSDQEIKTRMVLEGEARGFDKVQRVVDDVLGTVEGGGGRPGLMAGLEKALEGITANLGKLDSTLDKVVRSAKELDGIASRSDRRRGGGGQDGATRAPAHADPSFSRGVLQGLGVAEYLPGMTRGDLARQAGGSLIGRSIRGVGGGLAGSAFTGIQGALQGWSSVPYVGPLVAGMGQTAVSAVEEALELQRAEREAAPYLNIAAGRRAAREAGESRWLSDFQPDVVAARARRAGEEAAQAALRSVTGSDPGAVREWPGAFGVPQATRQLIASGQEPSYMMKARIEAEARVREEAAAQRDAAMGSAAGAAYRRAAFGAELGATGVRHGLDLGEATRAFSELMRARGGTAGAGSLGAALAAQSGFGIDLGTSGALMRGGRIGADAMGGTDAGRLAMLIGNAMRLGLEGSEIGAHLMRMAEGIARFESSGIPLAGGAIDSVARALVGAGMANSVAAGRGASFVAALQGRAASEGLPSSSLDYAALVHLGGYQGGGAEDAFRARANLVRGSLQPGGFDELTRLFGSQVGTGPYGRAFGVERGFRGLGLQLGPDESMAMEARAFGRTMTPEQEAAIARVEARFRSGISTVDELEAAGDVTGSGLQRAASIRNQRMGAGASVMAVMQDFESRALRATHAFTPVINQLERLAPALDALVTLLEEALSELPRARPRRNN